MDENNNYEKQDEIVISFRKIWDNVIQYWWICVIGLVIAVIGVAGLTLTNYRSQRNSLEASIRDLEKIEEDDEEKEYSYRATSMVYLARDEVDLTKQIQDAMKDAQDIENRSDYVALYKEYLDVWLESTNLSLDKTLLYDCIALLYSNDVITELNEALVRNGYEEYDPVYEYIEIQLRNNARFYALTVAGKDSERIEFIIRTATGILMERSKEVLGIKDSKLIDDAYIIEYIVNEDGSQTQVTPRMDAEKEEARLKELESAQLNLTNHTIGLGSFLSMKNILIIFVGVFFGLGIIFVMILLDKKVRSRDELAMYFDYPILGDVNQKSADDEQYNVLMTALNYKFIGDNLSSVLITGAGSGERVIPLVNKLMEAYVRNGKKVIRVDITTSDKDVEKKISDAKKKDIMLIVNAIRIDKSAAALQSAGLVDAVIMAVSTNSESIPEIGKGFSNIGMADGKVLGSILIDSRKFGASKA